MFVVFMGVRLSSLLYARTNACSVRMCASVILCASFSPIYLNMSVRNSFLQKNVIFCEWLCVFFRFSIALFLAQSFRFPAVILFISIFRTLFHSCVIVCAIVCVCVCVCVCVRFLVLPRLFGSSLPCLHSVLFFFCMFRLFHYCGVC